jgi:glycosyltransferase involved in cell wall biosynthesis
MKNKKIAVVHDHLGFMGGGERTALIMAIALEADFITAYKNKNTFPEYQEKLGGKLISLSEKIITTRVVRFFWLRFLFWKNRKVFNKYDCLIASGQTATEVVAKYGKKEAKRIVYTHSTPRRVFDLFEMSRKMYPLALRPFYTFFALNWKQRYLKAIKKFDINIANSENVKKRINEHAKSTADYVIWPPIITCDFKWKSQGDYYLSWGRIDEAKRIDLIVKAFREMPDKKIIIASSGPYIDKIKELSRGYKNIEITGRVSEDKLKALVGGCIAGIYIPIEEDAGITHLEANAAGKPYLGVKEGGLLESTIDGETGILIRKDPGVEDVVAGIKKMTPEWCLNKRSICEKHALKYDKEVFVGRVKEVVLSMGTWEHMNVGPWEH